MAEFSISYSVKEKGNNNGTRYEVENISTDNTLENLFKFTKGSLIKISQEALKEEQAKGFDKKPVTIVDGKFNKAVESVNPLGKIQFVARQSIKQLLKDAYAQIQFRTKIVTGEYSKNNVVLLNGQQVANNKAGFDSWIEKYVPGDRDRIRFINTAPYARKLELYGVTAQGTTIKVGKRDKRRHTLFLNTVKKPNGVYQLSYKAIQRKYKNNSFIKFEVVPGSEIAGLSGPNRTRKLGKNRGRPYVYPSILIMAIGAGTTDIS